MMYLISVGYNLEWHVGKKLDNNIIVDQVSGLCFFLIAGAYTTLILANGGGGRACCTNSLNSHYFVKYHN